MTLVADVDLETVWACASQEAMQRIADIARRALDAPIAVITSFAEADQTPQVRSVSGAADDRPQSGPLCRDVFQHQRPLLLPTATEAQRLSHLMRETGIAAYLGAPVRLSDGRCLGTLAVFDTTHQAWAMQDLTLIVDLAAILAEQIELSQARPTETLPNDDETGDDRNSADRDGADRDVNTALQETQAEELPFHPSRTRILLADDLDLNRRLIADMLSIDGYLIDCVADGTEAVAAMSQRHYDVVLMDMIMPGMDGIAATRAIRALPYPACNVPIVALTANSFADQLESCIKAGMDATLVKPMSVDALSSTVALWARGRKKAA